MEKKEVSTTTTTTTGRSTEPGSVPVTHSGNNKSDEFRLSLILLRALLLTLAIISFVLMVTDSQTSTVPIPFLALPQPVFVTKTAKYELVTGIKFFVDAMGVVIGYTVLFLLFNIGLLVTRGTVVDRKAVAWICFITDSMMAYLITAAASVATEIGYIAERGEAAVLWNKVCNSFAHFCTVYAVSVTISFLTGLVSFLVVSISAYHLFRLYGISQAQKSVKDSVPL